VAELEKAYYRSGEVLITNTRAEIAGRTFAMANITAVSLVTINPSLGGPIALLVIGGCFALLGIPTLAGIGGVFLVMGIAAIVAGCAWWSTLKRSYAVNLSSASGESRAMQSQNREEIEPIMAAITQAIIARG
jgi:hypothetical protein